MIDIEVQQAIEFAIANHNHLGIESRKIPGLNSLTITTVTSAITLSTEGLVLVDSTAGAITITLPTAVGSLGRSYEIKDWKGQSSTKNITINTTAAQTIDGAASKTLNSNFSSLHIISDGNNWSII